ncbi:MAG: shikimate kinase, partial [Lentisphaerota bacterium]
MKRIFIIGPGGVGKTTCGRIFANKISYDFIDLDSEFMERIGNIGDYIESNGYLNYCRENSKLFYELLKEQNTNIVFVLSSGFLVHGDVDSNLKKHANSIRDLGFSILLLPSESLEKTEEIVVARQLSRGLNCQENRERQKIKNRFHIYLKFGDIKVFSADSPESIAEIMKQRYQENAELISAGNLVPLDARPWTFAILRNIMKTVITENDFRSLLPECCRIGFASIEDYKAAEKKQLLAKLPSTKTVIVIAHNVQDSLEWTWLKFKAARTGETSPADIHCLSIAESVLHRLESNGNQSTILPYPGICGPMFKTIAVPTGLGMLGDNFLFMNHDWGPWMHLRVIITDAVVEFTTHQIDNPCTHCGKCV